MKVDLVRAPIVLGALVAGTLVLISALEMLTSNPRWDDHLLDAAGVLVGGLFLSFTLWLGTAAFRPRPGAPKRVRFIGIAGLVALVLLILIAVWVAMWIDDMSFP